MRTATNKSTIYKRERGKLYELSRQWELQVMVLPAVILIFIFSYLPMYGVLMAFQDYNIFEGMANSPWVGLKHFEMFFQSPEFSNVMRNTIVISLLKLCIGFPAPIILALFLNEVNRMWFKRLTQTVSYLPHFMSWVIISGFAASILAVDNGSLNLLLEKTGLIDEPINFLSTSKYFWVILASANVWKEIGFSSIVYLAAIASIDPQIYEAAAVDGASRFKRMFIITIPSIMPIVMVFFVLAIGNLLSAGFEDILLLGSSPVVQDVAQVIDTYVYKYGIQSSRLSYATAVGLFKSAISVVLLFGANKMARKYGGGLW
ncbi:putative multiple-sugar transport system permease YteP [Paenibacillus auburnensis]|jgi:putative aldouronate transport system permease protein|uniref:Multiple-sugar transport system permease YteP n=2 Tax=Paenibacillus auburnensis TaxID=2905649 RepID=A0ABM9C9Z3_9BACL|nr:putative multiple-sugar transport system permease YteP [Paenibacillus auburnensis]